MLRPFVYFSDKLVERRIEPIVEISEDKAVVSQNVYVHVQSIFGLAFESFKHVAHHFITLVDCVLTMSQMARNKSEHFVVEGEGNFDATLVTNHAEKPISVSFNASIHYFSRVLSGHENDKHDFEHVFCTNVLESKFL